MKWNWQHSGWPNFTWNVPTLHARERHFVSNAGVSLGARSCLGDDEGEGVLIEILSGEGADTSDIEGEHMDRQSLQSSIRRHLGLSADRRSSPAEAGVAEMMVDFYRNPYRRISHSVLCDWHAMLMSGRRDLSIIGAYRTHEEPMEIVSGPIGPRRKVHFVAPPSSAVPGEMERLIDWIQLTGEEGPHFVPSLARAAVAHLWFESIHPFEDGNGRIGRALSETILAQSLPTPSITGLSGAILRHQKAYYAQLQAASRGLDASRWVDWFSTITLQAQSLTLRKVLLVAEKGRVLRELGNNLNTRQIKLIDRLYGAEMDGGFKGGLSASNYRALTGATSATATRDLAALVESGVLIRIGELKATRYYLQTQVDKTGLTAGLPDS